MQILQVYRSIELCPNQNLRSEKTLMFAHVTSNFHGKEWFSNISMKVEGENEPRGHLMGNSDYYLNPI